MSKSAFRERIRSGMAMMAPIVPNGLSSGAGMK
jgi:hypothetical protein